MPIVSVVIPINVSIIVPVYNVDKYLRRCVDSILTQTMSDFELLLIDDGSTDGSGAICEEYAQKDSRVRVFHKKNGGVSSARNMGLDNARGEWITFIDSDDYVTADYLEALYDNDRKADFSMSYYKAVGWDSWVSNPFSDTFFNYSEMDRFIEKYLISANMICGKLLRRIIIEENNLHFDSNLKYGEDTALIYKYIGHCKSARTISKATYIYNCMNENSANKTIITIPELLPSISEIDRTLNRIVSIFNLQNNEFADRINNLTINRVFSIMLKDPKTKITEIESICDNDTIKQSSRNNQARKSIKRKVVDLLVVNRMVYTIKLINFVITISNRGKQLCK